MGRVSFYKKTAARQVLGIPPHIDPVALISIGYTTEFQDKPVLESVGWGRRLKLEEVLFAEDQSDQSLTLVYFFSGFFIAVIYVGSIRLNDIIWLLILANHF